MITRAPAIARARQGGGPSLLDCQVNRYYGHFEGDAQTYRGPDETKKLRDNRDCIAMFAQRVTISGEVSAAELTAIDREVAELIADSVAEAKSAPKPESEELLTDVYVSY